MFAHNGVLVRLVERSTDLVEVALRVDKRVGVCLGVHLLVRLNHLRVVGRCGVHGRLVKHLVGMFLNAVTGVAPSLSVCALQSFALLVLLFVIVAP